MKKFKLPSTDTKNELHVVTWEPSGEPELIVQISHGMVEYIERYDGVATYLAERGILVIGNDHLGHGHTAKNDSDLGYFGSGMSKTVVDDLHTVTKYIKGRYPTVPLVLLGHSMGSFMARRYLMTYGNELDGAIIVGTGKQPTAVLGTAKGLCKAIKAFRGERYRSKLIANMSFSGYNKRIKPLRTKNDWLSRDNRVVDKYNADKYCTFIFTLNGYQTLFEVLTYIQTPENILKLPKSLPMIFLAGKEDPVGAYGKGVEEVYNDYKSAGVQNISIKLYENDRHEILNELDKERVYADIYAWLSRIKG